MTDRKDLPYSRPSTPRPAACAAPRPPMHAPPRMIPAIAQALRAPRPGALLGEAWDIDYWTLLVESRIL